jgi:predicted transcriptional regulator
MPAFSLRLPQDLERRLGEEALHCGQPRSELIREALQELLRRREQERFMAGLVAAAEALASDSSARAESLNVAADFLPAERALGLCTGTAERSEVDDRAACQHSACAHRPVVRKGIFHYNGL